MRNIANHVINQKKLQLLYHLYHELNMSYNSLFYHILHHIYQLNNHHNNKHKVVYILFYLHLVQIPLMQNRLLFVPQ